MSDVVRFPWYPRPMECRHVEGWEYSLYFDREGSVALLEVSISWVAVYSVWFWLREADLRLFLEDRAAFRTLARRFAQDQGTRAFADQFLRSEGPGPRRASREPERVSLPARDV